MSTEQVDENDVRERISTFMMRNFPQIWMHGGDANILDLDLDDASVTIALSGACSGCGISPMTIQALQHRLVAEIPELRVVNADTGMGDGGSAPLSYDPDDVPF